MLSLSLYLPESHSMISTWIIVGGARWVVLLVVAAVWVEGNFGARWRPIPGAGTGCMCEKLGMEVDSGRE
jgi:hypothetical protein